MSSAVDHVVHVDHFKHVPIGDVRESSTNPRRHFDKKGLEDLTASVQAKGILVPLLVVSRQNKGEDWFEIVAGARRYRAAKAAGLAQLPVIVRQLSAEEVLECQVIENLQREDVHPLDEAKGYEALMAAPYRMKAAVIATKVGKSERYIYDSRKLLDLTKGMQQIFLDGSIEKGHAILLARLTPAEQATVLGTKSGGYEDGGLLLPSNELYAEEEGLAEEPYKACSVRELDSWIKRHIRFNATKVDTFLFPETAAKVTEATDGKRKMIEITHEYLASDEVRQAGESRVYGERAWKRADGHEGSKPCERSVLGVIASGHGQGNAFQVCINKDRCLVHWGTEIKAREKRSKDIAKTGGSAAADAKARKAQQTEHEHREKQEAKRKHWDTVASKIEAAVMEKIPKLPATSTGVLGDLIVKALTGYQGRKMTAVPRGKTAEDLVRFLGAMVLRDEVHEWNAHEQFPPIARAIGVDLSPFVTVEKVQMPAQKKGTTA